ncbi:MAG: hypothetical protein Q8J97_04480, partial [Flavobacteriaceae bacterium]|nr:hypothetical protein [Flavobacteriaceae bacterium]
MALEKLDTIALAKSEREKEIIRSLWRAYYGLYNEKYRPEKVLDEFGEPIDPWLRNKLSEFINFGQALGQHNLIEGNRSIGIGQGTNTKSFEEIVLGAYNIIPTGQNPGEWVPTDLLMTLGNGPDEDHRSNVFEIYKNGLFRFLKAIEIGEYPELPEGQTPGNGAIQFITNAIQLYYSGEWHNLTQNSEVANIVNIEINNPTTNLYQSLSQVINNHAGAAHESYLIENTANAAETVVSSWSVLPYAQQVGEFKAVVMVRNKTTNTIITLIALLSFDYSEAPNVVLQSNLITDAALTLTVGVNG